MYSTAKQVLALNWVKNPTNLIAKSGVYRLVDKRTQKTLYIGKSTNLGHRFFRSCHKVYDKSKHDIYVVFEYDKAEIGRMEHRFIELLCPPLNIRRGQGGDYPTAELDKVYKNIFD